MFTNQSYALVFPYPVFERNKGHEVNCAWDKCIFVLLIYNIVLLETTINSDNFQIT